MAVGQPIIGVIDGDPVVRDALEVLLQAAGYHIRSVPEPASDERDELLADFDLLLVAPEVGAERMKALLDSMSSLTVPAKIPILELVPEGGEQIVRGGRVVLWPCSVEQLKRAIDAALSTAE
jgi:hypothetical protein